MQEALYYAKEDNDKVKCLLCPWFCELKPGQTGYCRVRKNTGGILETLVYDKVAALGIDPIEKKPLYHFLPGKQILSLGLVGCNLRCTFCQNHNISQCQAETYNEFTAITATQLTEKALSVRNNAGLAFTYNEPFTFYEFMFAAAELSHDAGMKNVVVSNGYINPLPLKNLLPYTDAYNIDLKAYDDQFYRKQTRGNLQPVTETIVIIAKSSAHLEITNLVIPGLNDNEVQFEEMAKWIAGETGADTPLHLSRYFPRHKLHSPSTSMEKLEQLYNIAKKYLGYVYLGNTGYGPWSDTCCPDCGTLLIRRNQGTVVTGNLDAGRCKKCGLKIPLVL